MKSLHSEINRPPSSRRNASTSLTTEQIASLKSVPCTISLWDTCVWNLVSINVRLLNWFAFIVISRVQYDLKLVRKDIKLLARNDAVKDAWFFTSVDRNLMSLLWPRHWPWQVIKLSRHWVIKGALQVINLLHSRNCVTTPIVWMMDPITSSGKTNLPALSSVVYSTNCTSSKLYGVTVDTMRTSEMTMHYWEVMASSRRTCAQRPKWRW